MVIGTHRPTVTAKAIARKAPSRPSLSLDSGDEEEIIQSGGWLTSSPKGKITDHVADDNASQLGSDEETANPPTAAELMHEVNHFLHLYNGLTTY